MDSTSDLPQIMTDDYARKCADAIVRVLVRRLGLTEKKERTMTYKTINGIRIAEVPASQLRVILYDDRKKSMGRNRCNAGFFSTPSENNVKFTLPVGHLACDYEAAEKWTRHYCEERGTFVGDKYRFDSGSWAFMNPTHGRAVSTLLLSRGKARIADVVDLPRDCDYAISGVPVMRSGGDVKFKTYVKGQGWNGQELRATWHVFVGLKQAESDTVFVMAMRTLTSNLVYSAEAFKKFKALGFYDVIKLDGGGSFYFNAGGSSVSTAENRRVCSILDFGPAGGNPYPEPTRALKKGASGNSVKWLQWELNRHGFVCDLDGSFGPNTDRLLREYQRSVGLTADGSCGPATRAQLLK